MQLHTEERKKMLEQAGFAEEVNRFLSEMEVPLLYEWSFLCAMEGMPVKELERICKNADKQRAQASELFMVERIGFLEKTYENNKDLKDQYTDLLHRVEIMYERASALEEGLNGKLTEAMQEKDRAFAQAVQMRDLVIRDKEKQLAELKKEMADLKGENKDLRQKYDVEREKVYSLENRLKTAEIRLSSAMKSDDRQAPGEEKKIPAADPSHNTGSDGRENPGHEDNLDRIRVFPYSRYGYPVKRYRGRHSFFNKGEREANEFIRLFIDNRDYSKEQKEYLIECLEQGDPLHVIKKFASPGLSVDYMDQMRRIIYERGY